MNLSIKGRVLRIYMLLLIEFMDRIVEYVDDEE